MGGKAHTPEQIIHKLRQAEVELSQGAKVPQVAKRIGVTEQTFDRRRAEYGADAGYLPAAPSGRTNTLSWPLG
jgi:transposase